MDFGGFQKWSFWSTFSDVGLYPNGFRMNDPKQILVKSVSFQCQLEYLNISPTKCLGRSVGFSSEPPEGLETMPNRFLVPKNPWLHIRHGYTRLETKTRSSIDTQVDRAIDSRQTGGCQKLSPETVSGMDSLVFGVEKSIRTGLEALRPTRSEPARLKTRLRGLQ